MTLVGGTDSPRMGYRRLKQPDHKPDRRLRALRGPGESCSDVIVRIAAETA
jgi:hypothetical protein